MVLASKKILIIKNKFSVIEDLIDRLTSEGFEVFRIENENAELRVALEKSPDLVLIDIFIPKTNGMATLKELRENNLGRNIPVIILANLSDPEVIATAVENKVSMFLVRNDWSFDEVIRKIRQGLKMTTIEKIYFEQ